MSEPELLLDSNIRLWVVLPIVFITFFVGMIRHYVSILLQSDKKLTREQVSDSQVLIRSRVLRENGKYIPKQSFLTRKYFFNNPEDGFFKKTKRKVVPPSPMTDPTMLTDMMKGNVTNVLPMILIGGWINMTFSGFVTTKVPFPLTLRFKPMLQQGIELLTLDASWVSSASWYFLNVFGLRSIYTLILGQDNAADQSRVMQEQMTGAAMAMPADTNKAFKAGRSTVQERALPSDGSAESSSCVLRPLLLYGKPTGRRGVPSTALGEARPSTADRVWNRLAARSGSGHPAEEAVNLWCTCGEKKEQQIESTYSIHRGSLKRGMISLTNLRATLLAVLLWHGKASGHPLNRSTKTRRRNGKLWN
ncbi:ER membrane protein complex subunit 3 isoform X2 [Chrysemys picta bellii]|uniref:ER membrane protein complex subunit 3 isoform X2 n=1 Tax=Chrysemys picta bellii TaxID=8478 RepID=UPI0032B20BC2